MLDILIVHLSLSISCFQAGVLVVYLSLPMSYAYTCIYLFVYVCVLFVSFFSMHLYIPVCLCVCVVCQFFSIHLLVYVRVLFVDFCHTPICTCVYLCLCQPVIIDILYIPVSFLLSVFICFIYIYIPVYTCVFTGGFGRSDGIIFVMFTDVFKQSAQLTALTGAIRSFMCLFVGQ